jgi:hypothetical protein
MSARSRLIAFGTCGVLAIAGVAVAVLASGTAGQIVAIVLLSLGFGGAVLLVFLEVGLSEDRARARAEAERRRRDEAERREDARPSVRPRWPRRPT